MLDNLIQLNVDELDVMGAWSDSSRYSRKRTYVVKTSAVIDDESVPYSLLPAVP